MASCRRGDPDLLESLGLSEQETVVLQSLDWALDLYRRLPELTEAELRTLWATDRVLRDMLCARAIGRDRREEVAGRA